MRLSLQAVVLVFVLGCAGAAMAQAPEPERSLFLVINQERILTGSTRGQTLLAEEEAARDLLRTEARAIETAFEDEERQLTDQRAELDAAAFRTLADAFDAKVVEARRDQDNRANALAAEFDQRRRQFYAEVAPVLVGVMEDRGALAIFDETSVLIADQALNITDEVISEIDGSFAMPAQTPGREDDAVQPDPEAAGPADTDPAAPDMGPALQPEPGASN